MLDNNRQRGSVTNYAIPIAIVISGGLIATAMFFSAGENIRATSNTGTNQPTGAAPQLSGSIGSVREVTADDHIKGDINAPVKIVEYSDFECPFCKRFHTTMNQIVNQYTDSGQVAWVYRHFPLDSLHPRNARIVAVASECVNELAGDDAFWQFTDRFFEVTPSNDRTDLNTVLPQLYREVGVDQSQIEACIASGRYDQHIIDDFDNAVATGGRGTPWSVVVGPDGQTFSLSGAQPLAAVQQLIELASQ
jgi:protein-disulfide isomerase